MFFKNWGQMVYNQKITGATVKEPIRGVPYIFWDSAK